MKPIPLAVMLFLCVSCSTYPSSAMQPTPTLTMTASPIITPTDSPTLLPTPTIIVPISSSTLSQGDAENLLLSLLQGNADCPLPCWFDLKPGETNAQSAKSLLEKLTAISLRASFKEDAGGAHWRINKDGLLIDTSASFTYNRLLSGELEYLRVTIDVKRELDEGGFETVWENPLNEQYLRAYRLPQVLMTHVQPQQVFVFANEGWRYFEVVLDYSNQGFVIWYTAPLESSGNKYIGCMSKTFTRLYLWAPEFSYTWAEGIVGTGDKYEIDSLTRDFQRLENVTSLSADEFYNEFIDTESLGCLETPKELWPGP